MSFIFGVQRYENFDKVRRKGNYICFFERLWVGEHSSGICEYLFPQIFPMLSYNDSPVIGEMIDTPAADVPHSDILVILVLIW